MLRSLLIPLDGSKLAEAILPWGLFLARERRLAVTLALVARSSNGAEPEQDRAEMSAAGAESSVAGLEAARAYLEATRHQLARDGVAVEIAVCTGPPAQALLDLADRIDASAIVLATHGHGNTRDVPLGRVAEQVVQEASIPVLLLPVREGSLTRRPALHRLLVPLDGSALAERGLDMAAELAEPDTSVLLVRVVEPELTIWESAEGHLPLEDAEATYRARAEATSYLQRLRQLADQERYQLQTRVALGPPDRQILAIAAEEAADLIVMVTHGASGARQGWLGSVATDVVRRASVPVFLVSARALAARIGRAYRVADVMTRDPISVQEHEPLAVVVRRLLRRRISGAPVVNAAGILLGVITEHDLLRWQYESAKAQAETPGGQTAGRGSLKDAKASDVMSHLAVSVEESMPLASAIPILLDLPYRRLPVTRDGYLVGVLSRADVLKAMAEQDAAAAVPLIEEAVTAP